MVIVMEMESGRRLEAPAAAEGLPVYGDDVMFSGWSELPREMPRLAQVEVGRRSEPDHEFLVRVYRSQR